MLESANTFSNKRRGAFAEDRALDYYRQRGFELHRRNHKVAGVEIDLILKKNRWLFVEVKTLQTLENISFRLSFAQQKRLLFARQVWQNQYQQDVALKVFFVSSRQMLELGIEDFF